MSPVDWQAFFGARRFRAEDEGVLQRAIAAALTAAGHEFEREVRLSARDRIDFLVGSSGIEVKIAGDAVSVLRQLARYAEHESIEGLVLVTTRMVLAARMPPSIGGKPLQAVHIPTGVA